jgi:hypothetical protein
MDAKKSGQQKQHVITPPSPNSHQTRDDGDQHRKGEDSRKHASIRSERDGYNNTGGDQDQRPTAPSAAVRTVQTKRVP